MDNSPITREDAAEIASDYLRTSRALQRSEPQRQPVMLLIAAQPGAGKTGLADDSRAYMAGKGGYVRVDADRLRESLPYYRELAKQDPENASARSQADAGLCVQELRRLAKGERRNLLEEGTYRSPDGVEKFIDGLKNDGYRVELRVLAVPREMSLLGVYQRYEKQIEGGISPRNIKDSYHDEAASGLLETIARVQSKVDLCTVHTREGATLAIDSQRAKTPLDVVESAQVPTPVQKAQIAAGWSWVYGRVQQRNDMGERAEAVSKHMVRAHHNLRQDPEASALYDKAAPPAAVQLSHAAASYYKSPAQDLNGLLKEMRGRGLSQSSFESVLKGVQEKLAQAASERAFQSTTPKHPEKQAGATRAPALSKGRDRS